eukprot:TRINITY_DN21216_c0_g1_i1.p1 TRINITY_DN21216_c0_g1~~TRINITY_DN21216_c0_g1_i1.p1  ORF type:complete len:819 (-),score=88.67 TRINITY_DN21216_c0_g1_i1:55-2259(-)
MLPMRVMRGGASKKMLVWVGVPILLNLLHFMLTWLDRKMTQNQWECFVVFSLMMISVCVPLQIKFFAGKLFGIQSEGSECESHLAEARLLFGFCLHIVATHVWLPVRWHILALGTVINLCVLAGTAPFSENLTELAFNGGLLFFLSLMTSYGKRESDLQDRIAFLAVIQEKTKRAGAEFMLEEASNGWRRGDNAHDDVQSLRSVRTEQMSLPSTTRTDKLFDSENISVNAIRALGLQERWYIKDTELGFDLHHEGERSPARVLGFGGFGVVFAGVYQGSPVAIKTIRDKSSIDRVLAFCNELRVIRRLRHPNIAQFYGACSDDDSSLLALVMELVDGDVLANVLQVDRTLQKNARMTDHSRLWVLVKMACALRYLHSRDPVVIHGDLKSSNIILEIRFVQTLSLPCALYNPKLLDFGLSRILTKHVQPMGGTILWVSPEVLEKSNVGRDFPAADVFSFGRLMQHVLTSSLSFRQAAESGAIIGEGFSDRFDGTAPPQPWWPHDASELVCLCKDLAESCLSTIPSSRPRILQVCTYLSKITLGQQTNAGARISAVQTSTNVVDAEPFFQQLRRNIECCGATATSTVVAPVRSTTNVVQQQSQMCSWDHLQPTPLRTQIAAITKTMSRWVPAETRDGAKEIRRCCIFHSNLNEVGRVCSELELRTCLPDNGWDQMRAQCAECGALILKNDIKVANVSSTNCVVCDADVLLPRFSDAKDILAEVHSRTCTVVAPLPL